MCTQGYYRNLSLESKINKYYIRDKPGLENIIKIERCNIVFRLNTTTKKAMDEFKQIISENEDERPDKKFLLKNVIIYTIFE